MECSFVNSPEFDDHHSIGEFGGGIRGTPYLIRLSVTFFSFFNHRGREEGTENTETCQDIRGQEHSRASGLKTHKGYT